MEENIEKQGEEPILDKVKEESEKIIKSILDEGIKRDNIEFLYKIVDIHKDIANEEYWLTKKEDIEMRYRGYSDGYGEYSEGGNYGRRGVPGTGRGRYRDGGYSEGSYGRRGVKGTGRGRYRGEEMMDEMMYHYGNYSESGQYGAEGESMEALSNLMGSAYEYFKELKENANSQDEIKMMEHYFKKMGQM